MSQQQVTQHRSAVVNGFDHRRTERDLGSHNDNSFMQPTRFHSGNSCSTGIGHGFYNHMNSDNIHNANTYRMREGNVNISKSGGFGRPLHDRFVFMTACLMGQRVEVQVKNGSIFSGVFHSTNEKDNGVLLKMAHLIKDGSIKGGKCDAVSEAPIKDLIILPNDLVQVIAKDVPVIGDELANGHARGHRHDILTDSSLSHAHYVELERALEPWTPDKDAPESIGLEDTFQNTWNRNWDQFETNKTLFGVESTFDEELYTTKLERGPQMKDLEREASRIAREIEGQVTKNFHLAEERGSHFSQELDSLDEESRFSSVLRNVDDDVGEDYEDNFTDNHNKETLCSNIAYTEVASIVCEDGQGKAFDDVDFENNFSHICEPLSAASSEVGQSVGVHQPIGYNSLAPSMQSASPYIHQNGQLHPQQMMYCQHGQAVYVPPFPQEMMQGPPLPQGLIQALATPQQGQHPKRCGAAV